jgi:VWFA-related protein
VVHYFAAGALEAQGNVADEQRELDTLVQEDPKSPVADQARQLLQQIKLDQTRQADAKLHPAEPVTFSFKEPSGPTSEEALRQAKQILQDLKTKQEIAEAEAEPAVTCADCAAADASTTTAAVRASVPRSQPAHRAGVFRKSVDEVALFFTATDHGKPVTDLTGADIGIRDDQKPPAAILAFRNQSQLPLRLGLVIDTSDSIANRFAFEQHSAINFLEKTITDTNDLAFVVGVNNSVLMIQDFTGDQKLMSRAVDQLAPSGGTALWDAVAFAVDKLANRAEEQPVAKILVVISDGEDNSSHMTLKQAMERAQHGEVAIYTVSTREYEQENASALLGDHALKTLAELTGGAALTPGSVRRLNSSLNELQQVIRGRYLVSYKPALFQRDGRYRAIDLTAQKDGHKLRVYVRKGYYASVNSPPSNTD